MMSATANNTTTSSTSAARRGCATQMVARQPLQRLPSKNTLVAAILAIEDAAASAVDSELITVRDLQEKNVVDSDTITPFHSTNLPEISLAGYAQHIASRCGYKNEGLAVGIALMARYATVTDRGVTPLAMHRLLGTCIQVGMKAASDTFVKNVFVAPIAGMSLDELNELEMYLLEALDFRAIPTYEELTDLPRALAALLDRHTAAAPSLRQVNWVLAQHASVAAAAATATAESHELLQQRPSFFASAAASAPGGACDMVRLDPIVEPSAAACDSGVGASLAAASGGPATLGWSHTAAYAEDDAMGSMSVA